jgi:peptidoglycan-associated lipoprotein
MTSKKRLPRPAGSLLAACLVVLGLAACSTAPEPPKVKADAGGPDKSLAVLTDVKAGSSQDFVLNAGRRTFFREGSAELDSVAKNTLDQQAAWLVRHPGWTVKIQGFADDPGSPEANVELSSRRAETVRAFLASLGVAPERMSAKGYGRTRLVRDCPDLSCKSQNRRVVTNLEGEDEPKVAQAY